jgi:hypothetical protein
MAVSVFGSPGGIPELLLPERYSSSANAVSARGYDHANS